MPARTPVTACQVLLNALDLPCDVDGVVEGIETSDSFVLGVNEFEALGDRLGLLLLDVTEALAEVDTLKDEDLVMLA